MIDPGQLRTRLVIQQPVAMPDDQGGVVRTWTTFATVWAQVTPLPPRREMQADAEGATQRWRILLRAGFSLTLQHRFGEGARLYRIVAIRDSADRRFIEIEAETRID